jgi:hypothetical protein
VIPVSSTTVTIARYSNGDANSSYELDSETDLLEPTASLVTVVSNLRAQINVPSGTKTFGPTGGKERVTFKFKTDVPTDAAIMGGDTMTDAQANVYTVAWARVRSVFGMTWVEGQCYQVVGAM